MILSPPLRQRQQHLPSSYILCSPAVTSHLPPETSLPPAPAWPLLACYNARASSRPPGAACPGGTQPALAFSKLLLDKEVKPWSGARLALAGVPSASKCASAHSGLHICCAPVCVCVCIYFARFLCVRGLAQRALKWKLCRSAGRILSGNEGSERMRYLDTASCQQLNQARTHCVQVASSFSLLHWANGR